MFAMLSMQIIGKMVPSKETLEKTPDFDEWLKLAKLTKEAWVPVATAMGDKNFAEPMMLHLPEAEFRRTCSTTRKQ